MSSARPTYGLSLLSGLACLIGASTAIAEVVTVDSNVSAVTVYNDMARVTRTATIELPEGRHRLLMPRLPERLDRDALEVSIKSADDTITLGAVDVRIVQEADLVNMEEEELVVELERLDFAVREQEDAIEAEGMVVGIIESIGEAIAKRTAENVTAEVPELEVWSETWAGLKEGAATSMARSRLAEREIIHLKKQIEQAERQLDQIRTGARATLNLDLEVFAAAPGTAEIEVAYLVPDASWSPIYEARLDSDAGILGWVQLASVVQGTGEDWSDVSLNLSTARPGAAAPLPQLPSWFIDVQQPAPPAPLRRQSEGAMADVPSLAMLAAPEQVALNVSTFQVSYEVPGLVNIPATREPYRVALDEHTLDAELSVRAIPKLGLEPQIYAEAVYNGEAPLLSGALILYRDGTYSGRNYLDPLAPGDRLDLAFGPDDLVTVEEIFETGERDQQGLIRSRQRHERRYRIEVTNHHEIAMPITILEQLPVPQDARITVELLDEATPPNTTDYDGRTGVLAWSGDYAPGESRTIRFAYVVTHPADIEVRGF